MLIGWLKVRTEPHKFRAQGQIDVVDNFNPLTSSTLHHSPSMRYIFSNELLEIPEDVKIKIRSRVVTVEGPRGEHQPNLKQATTSRRRPSTAH